MMPSRGGMTLRKKEKEGEKWVDGNLKKKKNER